jgi:hypothetical protein
MIENKLKEIAELCLYNEDKITSNIDKGLYSGLMGLAIFNFEYYKYSKEEKYYDSGLTYLEQIIGNFSDVN